MKCCIRKASVPFPIFKQNIDLLMEGNQYLLRQAYFSGIFPLFFSYWILDIDKICKSFHESLYASHAKIVFAHI